MFSIFKNLESPYAKCTYACKTGVNAIISLLIFYVVFDILTIVITSKILPTVWILDLVQQKL